MSEPETEVSTTPVVSPVKTARTIEAECPSCGNLIFLDRALMVTCPDCGAGPGVSCIDLRNRKAPTTKARVAVHPARGRLLKDIP